ncbi:MAG: ribosome assembly cofactor RimP [Dysgonamonadaceae bacterium]
MIDKILLKNIVEAHLDGTENYLVDIQVKPGNILLVEIDNDKAVGIDDCIALSRKIESSLNREEEDFELEVGSAGISSPFKILRQYKKNIGNEVEVLTKDGRKLAGVLKDAQSENFTLTITKKVKPEGAKRKIEVEEDLTFAYDEVKYTKYQIRFK